MRITLALTPVSSMLMYCAASWGQWDAEYYASSHLFPEDSGSGWVFGQNGSGFQRAIVGDALYVNTMPPGDPWRGMDWINRNGHFDFAAGFVLEARLKMVNATNLEPRWGGACIYSRSITGYNMGIDVDPDRVILGSIFDYVSFAMDTTDAFHTYRAEAEDNGGKLYVDGILRLEMPLRRDNNDAFVHFGDQGWEGGEMYYDYVRYGIPEPASTAVLAVLAPFPFRRRARCAAH